MGNIIRWLVGIPLAAFVTFALFVAMKILISGDFKPQAKLQSKSGSIIPKSLMAAVLRVPAWNQKSPSACRTNAGNSSLNRPWLARHRAGNHGRSACGTHN